MTAQTATIADFLLARIAEDRAWWDSATFSGPRGYDLRVRMRAECEAKRRIVEHCEVDHLAASPGDPYVLQLLAQPYADHPDFRPEWRA